MTKIPPSIIGAVAPLLGERYTHTELNALFLAHRFPGDPPLGNKVEKCLLWMREANDRLPNPLENFGFLIAEMMDAEYEAGWGRQPAFDPRPAVRAALAREGLSYHRGGQILGAALTGPSRSLAERLKDEGIAAVEREFTRAYDTITTDPEAAVTAACAILESVCKTYLDAEGLIPSGKLTLGPLWAETSKQLGLSPKDVADDDLKRILSGLFSVADGVAALRTHEGSAHGRSDKSTYRLAPRHARLAVHAAHTMAMFVLETWEERRLAAPFMPPRSNSS